MKVWSFGFRRGCMGLPLTLIDVRGMRNPFAFPQFMTKTGIDENVQEFVKTDALFDSIFKMALQKALDGEDIGFGCYGGQHRSVAMAEITARELRHIVKETVEIKHRDLHGQ